MSAARPSHGRLSQYRDLLSQTPAFRHLWIARAVSALGDSVHLVALVWLARRTSSPGAAVGVVAFMLLAPQMIAAPFLGPLVDRFARRDVMITADVARIATAALVPVVLDLWGFAGVVTVTVVHGTLTALSSTAYLSLMPDVVGRERLMAANGLVVMTNHVAMSLGAAVGGFLVARRSLAAAFWSDATTFLLSAVVVAFVAETSVAPGGRLAETYSSRLRAGVEYARRHTGVAAFIAVGALGTVGFAPAIVALSGLVDQRLDAGADAFGSLQALTTVGLASGAAIVGRIGQRWDPIVVMAVGYLMMGVATFLLGLASTLSVAAVWVLVRSASNSVLAVPSATIMQQLAPSEMRGRIVSLIIPAHELPRALLLPVSGLLLEVLGVRTLYWAMAAAIVGAGALALWSAGAIRDSTRDATDGHRRAKSSGPTPTGA